jgi:hypothetical protein
MFPDAAPLLCGAKASETDALSPGAIVLGKDIPVRRNSGLVEVADVMVTLDPTAVRVTGRTWLVPTVTLPKFNAAALAARRPEETPVPERPIARFEFDAFDTTVTAPPASPPTLGLNRTPNVTLCPRSRLKGRLRPLTPNPAPDTVACEMVTVE